MNENKNQKKDIEVTSIQGILDETLESLTKALDEVRKERPKSDMSEDKTQSIDLKTVKATIKTADKKAESHRDVSGDTKTINLNGAAKPKPDKSASLKADIKKKETASDAIAETIKDNIRKEKNAEIPDVRIVSKEKSKAQPKNKKRGKKSEELKFNGHKTAFCIFNTVFVSLVFFSIAIALIVLKRPSGFMSSENRNYAELPSFTLNSYLSGEYTSGINTYFTDTTPNREQLKVFANRFTDLFGFKLDNTVIQGANKSSAKRETFDEKKEITSATAVTFTTKNTETAPTTTAEAAETTPVTD